MILALLTQIVKIERYEGVMSFVILTLLLTHPFFQVHANFFIYELHFPETFVYKCSKDRT